MTLPITVQPYGAQEDKPFIVSVLFTRRYDRGAKLVYWLTGRCYTHAALGLGEQTERFYSFGLKGFREEHPAHRKLKDGQKESLCFQFRVSREEFEQVERELRYHMEQKAAYSYNYWGVTFGLLHLAWPFKRKPCYFCSEFVSAKLKQLGSFRLKRSAQRYMPTTLARDLARQQNLCRVLLNEV
jgi:hypothetical protein